ncbi:MAG: hypothetical protein ACXVBE_13750, partial [Bdellovibrionota bacterium]
AGAAIVQATATSIQDLEINPDKKLKCDLNGESLTLSVVLSGTTYKYTNCSNMAVYSPLELYDQLKKITAGGPGGESCLLSRNCVGNSCVEHFGMKKYNRYEIAFIVSGESITDWTLSQDVACQ